MKTRPPTPLVVPAAVRLSTKLPTASRDILVLPVQAGPCPGGDSLLPVLDALLPAAVASALVSARAHARATLAPLQNIDMDDAMRRIRPANTFLMEWQETWISALADTFAASNAREIAVPTWTTLDAPSLRIIVHAWLRAPSRPRTAPPGLCLCQATDTTLLPAEAVQAAHTLRCLGIPVPEYRETCYAGGRGDACISEPSTAATAFLERNYAAVPPVHGSVAHQTSLDFSSRCLPALVFARTGGIAVTVAAWRSLAEDASLPPWDRASACSSEAVYWAKELTPVGMAEAATAIARGRDLLAGESEPRAAHIRGWLWNNAGLVAILKHVTTGSHDHLSQAEYCLAEAFAEAGETSENEFPNLHHNLVANAVQLLETRNDCYEAVRVLDTRFGGSSSPVYHYRRAGLLVKAGELDAAQDAYQAAAAACPPNAWFFREVIHHGLGCLLSRRDANRAAAVQFEEGAALCAEAGYQAGLTRHHAAAALRPLPKLPPYIAELDLCAPHQTSVNLVLAG